MLMPDKIYPIKVEDYGFLYIITYLDSKAAHITTRFTKMEKKNPNLVENYKDIVASVPKTNLHTTTEEKVIEEAKQEVDKKRDIVRVEQERMDRQKREEGPPASSEEISKMVRDFHSRMDEEDRKNRANWYTKVK